MRRSLSISALATAAAVLMGCAAGPTDDPPTPSASSASPTTTPSSTPSQTAPPAAAPMLTMTLDGLALSGESSAAAVYSDGAAVVGLMTLATGMVPAAEEVAGCPEGYGCGPTQKYDFSGVTVYVRDTGYADVRVLAATVGGVPVSIKEGLTVGSTRAEALVAGARETGYPPEAPNLQIGDRAVPDTNSYATPGAVGVDYLLLFMDGDTVTQIAVGNDYTDL